MAESINGLYKAEVIHRKSWKNRAEVELAILTWVDGITIDDCWEGWARLLRQKQKKLIMLPSETMIWQPEFTDKTLSRKPGAVQELSSIITRSTFSTTTIASSTSSPMASTIPNIVSVLMESNAKAARMANVPNNTTGTAMVAF